MSALDQFVRHLKPGQVYRRRELALQSTDLDRHLAQLLERGTLTKLSRGLYACPTPTVFGDAPPDETLLLQAFLRDDHFVVVSPSHFNALGFGTTQLYNYRVVINRKRHGTFNLGGRSYFFHRRMEVPSKLTEEFLVVELVNRLQALAENREQVLANVVLRIPEFDIKKLTIAIRKFGTYSTQLKFNNMLGVKIFNEI